MYCPGCKKEHLISLSVCPACGVMTGDSVREELESKITVVKRPKEKPKKRREPRNVQKPSKRIKLNPPPEPVLPKREKTLTSEISAKKTNRTLLEFQSKDGTAPEWRTQVKNAVHQRKIQKTGNEVEQHECEIQRVAKSIASADNEFFDAAEIIEETPENQQGSGVLANALKRINNSRDLYFIEETGTSVISEIKPPRKKRKTKPQKNEDQSADTDKEEKTSVNFPETPQYNPNVDLYDTSELDPYFEPAKVSSETVFVLGVVSQDFPVGTSCMEPSLK